MLQEGMNVLMYKDNHFCNTCKTHTEHYKYEIPVTGIIGISVTIKNCRLCMSEVVGFKTNFD